MADSDSNECLAPTDSGLLASRHAPALVAMPVEVHNDDSSMMDSRHAPSARSANESPDVEAVKKKKKKHQRVRKSTRDARKREMERYLAAQAAAGLSRERLGSAEAMFDEVESSQGSEEDEGVEQETRAEEVFEASASIDNASGTEESPATNLSLFLETQPMISSQQHDDTIKRLRDQHNEHAESLYNQLVEAETEAAETKTALASSNAEIVKLKAEIEELHNDVDDPQRGYAVQISTAEEEAKISTDAIRKLRRDLTTAESKTASLESDRSQLSNTVRQLQSQIKSRTAEVERLQAQNEELVATIEAPADNPQLVEAEEELAQWYEYDDRLMEQLDHILQGMVSSGDAIDKVEALGRTLQEARDAADRHQVAHEAAQQELDKRKSPQQSIWSISHPPAISYEPYLLPSYSTQGTQTGTPTFTVSTATIVDEKPVISPVVSHQDASVQTVGNAQYSSTETQTEVSLRRDATTQTTAPRSVDAIAQIVAPSLSVASTQTISVIVPPISKQRDCARQRTNSMQTRPLTSQPRTSETEYLSMTASKNTPSQIASAVSGLEKWVLLSIFSVLLLWLWDAYTRVVDNPDYWTLSGYQSDMYKRDLAKVGFERWLGIDTSFPG